MPKPSTTPKNKTFSFAVVEYHAYNPVVHNCRAYIEDQDGGHTTFFDRPTWKELFSQLRSSYPNAKFDIPDVLPVIKYDEQHRQV